MFYFFHCQPHEEIKESLQVPRPALRPLAQDLVQSPGSELRLGLLAWAGAETPGLWRPSCQEEEEEEAQAQAQIQ